VDRRREGTLRRVAVCYVAAMIEELKRHQVQVLHAAGLSVRRIARETRIDRRSVRRIVREEPVVPTDDPRRRLRVVRGPGRPSSVVAHRSAILHILKEEPSLLSVEILRRVRELGYEGGKSALYDFVAMLRAPVVKPLVRFEGLAGEFSQHDFGSVGVRYDDSTEERVHFFASRLKYSRFVHVRVVENEKVEPLVRALLEAFEVFGGVPLVSVFDNPKTIVIRREGSKIEWNVTFGQAALDLRFGPELCWPHRPQEKGSVENLVGWVKGSFFKVRRFANREDLDAQLLEWLREVNETRPSRATDVIPLVRLAEERLRLRPVPIASTDYALRFPVLVGPTGTVEHGGYRYAMPPEAIGIPGTLHLYVDRVRIVAGRHVAAHPRVPPTGTTSYCEGHRAKALAAVSGERARLYAKRQQLLELGGAVEAYLTEVVHSHPRTWKSDVEALHSLLLNVGAKRLLLAIEAARSKRQFGSQYVIALIVETA
jgi:transposase